MKTKLLEVSKGNFKKCKKQTQIRLIILILIKKDLLVQEQQSRQELLEVMKHLGYSIEI